MRFEGADDGRDKEGNGQGDALIEPEKGRYCYFVLKGGRLSVQLHVCLVRIEAKHFRAL